MTVCGLSLDIFCALFLTAYWMRRFDQTGGAFLTSEGPFTLALILSGHVVIERVKKCLYYLLSYPKKIGLQQQDDETSFKTAQATAQYVNIPSTEKLTKKEKRIRAMERARETMKVDAERMSKATQAKPKKTKPAPPGTPSKKERRMGAIQRAKEAMKEDAARVAARSEAKAQTK